MQSVKRGPAKETAAFSKGRAAFDCLHKADR